MTQDKRTAQGSRTYSSEHYSNDNAVDYTNRCDQARVVQIIKLVGTGNKVLDIGCFNGVIGEKVIENGNEVFGIDASSEAVAQAKMRGVKAVVGDLEEKFPYEDGVFDVCVSGEILEHIVDTNFFMREVRRVLKPNGHLVLSTPNAASLGRRLILLFGRNPYFEAAFNFPPSASAGHVRYFVKGLLVSFLQDKGFEVIELTSDRVNLSASGSLGSEALARALPTLGRVLIVRAQRDAGPA